MKPALQKISAGEHLSREEASSAMRAIMEGDATEAQIGAFLMGMKLKGEQPQELAGFVEVMREKSLKITAPDDAIDMCGTGGDRSGTFNVSTTAAFVVAGAGVAVAKHGNRSVSSACGSSDVLRALGVNVEVRPDIVERCLHAVGMGFLFAPLFHPSMRFAAKPRVELGMKTCFNMLGPMTNPAGVQRQLVGTYDNPTSRLMAEVFESFHPKRVVLVTSDDGLDEVSLGALTQVIDLADTRPQQTYAIAAASYGMARCLTRAIRGGTPEQNARITLDVLSGEHGPYRDTVIANASLALLVAGKARSLYEGVAFSAESIDSGRAMAKLERLREMTTA